MPEVLQGVDKKPFDLIMDGNPLFKRAVGYLSEIAMEALNHNALTCDDIGLFVPHQANIRIIHGMAKNLHLPLEKVYTNVQRYGNTSSASIPLALDEANREGRLNSGDNVLLRQVVLRIPRKPLPVRDDFLLSLRLRLEFAAVKD